MKVHATKAMAKPKPKTTAEGLLILKNAIRKETRHIDYARVCKVANDYKGYVTGEQVADLLRQFTPRENDDLFAQRQLLTSLTTPDIANTLATPGYKVGRTTANIAINWDTIEKTTANRKQLNDVAAKFFGDVSVDNYLTYRMVQLDQQDPNAFIVVEFEEETDPTKPNVKANPYPFEVSAHEAIDFEYINNILQWLLVLSKNKTRHTLYLENDSIVADKIDKERIPLLKPNEGEVFYKDPNNKESDIWLIKVFSHKGGRVPARRVGTIKDPLTENRTCVPMMHAARSYFEKAIKTVSEFDLTNALHTFPKTYRYGTPCPGNMKNGILCEKGRIVGGEKDGYVCPECNGSGWENPTSTAKETIVRAPKELKDMISLDMMMAYKSPPIDLVEFQKKYGLYELKELAIKAVFNGDTYVKDSVAATATEKNIDLESVYDTLKPFADSWSNMWVHIMTLIATFRDMGAGLTIQHSFPKDFKMESLSMLFASLKAANDSGAPSYVKASITHDIAKKIYIDQPQQLLKIQVKEKFYPFNGKTADEINYILANALKTKFDQVLYASFDQIFIDIENEQTGEVSFYEMEYKKQKDLLNKKVLEYIDAINKEEAANNATTFNTDPNTGV